MRPSGCDPTFGSLSFCPEILPGEDVTVGTMRTMIGPDSQIFGERFGKTLEELSISCLPGLSCRFGAA
jgi:hypothetical protein